MDLIDTHCHIDVEEFDADRDAVLAHAHVLGVRRMAVPGYVADRWPTLIEVCRRHPGLFPAPGLHPMYTAAHHPGQLRELERLIGERPLVAIGEIGLDYFIDDPDRDAQQFYLEAQLAIAATAGLPVLLHIRKAHDEVAATIRRLRFAQGGIAHAFGGSTQQAMRLIDLGFRIGVCATVTHERATRIRSMVCELPLDALVLETDAPDIPGAAHRGDRNSPEYLPEVLEALAGLRRESAEEIAARTTANAVKVLRLKP